MNLQLAFAFTATNVRQKPVKGVIYATNKSIAHAKLRRNGMQPHGVTLSVGDTLRALLRKEFRARDLVRLYRTVGRRLSNGRPLSDGLESATEFVEDDRLKQAALIMLQALNDGRREHEAMLAADFPYRDAMIVRAASASGRTGEAFQSIADDTARRQAIRDAVAKFFRIPKIMALVMWAFLFGVIHWMTPKTIEFTKNINASLSPLHEAFFEFATTFNENIAVASAIYWSIPVLFVWALRSRAVRWLIDQIATVRTLSTKADMASLWSGFALLYDAGIPPAESAKIIRAAAERPDSEEMFRKFERVLATGAYIEVAAEKARFPKFVLDGVRAATSSGSTVQGIRDMVSDAEEDTRMLTERLAQNMELGSMAVMAVMVLAMFYVTYYPIMSVALKNV